MKQFRRKPKPYIESIVRSSIPGLAKLCSLPKIPYVTFSKKEIKDMGLRRHSNLANRYRGMAWKDKNVIFISPRIEEAEQARKTLAHEFCHLRFPYLTHGERFEGKVKELLAGEQQKPYAPR